MKPFSNIELLFSLIYQNDKIFKNWKESQEITCLLFFLMYFYYFFLVLLQYN